MTPSSLRSQVAALLGDLESALCAPLGSPDGSADADAVTAAAAPAAAAPAASPFSLGSGSPFALSSGSPFSPSAPRAFGAAACAAVAPAPAATSPAAAPAAPAASKGESLAELEARLEAAESEEAPEPCRPHSRDDFLRRVHSFSNARLWFAKPAALSPPQCARHGWRLGAAADTLVCRVCLAEFKCPTSLDDPAALSAAEGLLRTAHQPLCAWRSQRAGGGVRDVSGTCPGRVHGVARRLSNPSPESFGSLLLPARFGAAPSLAEGAARALESLRARHAALLRLPSLPALADGLDHAPCARRRDEASPHTASALSAGLSPALDEAAAAAGPRRGAVMKSMKCVSNQQLMSRPSPEGGNEVNECVSNQQLMSRPSPEGGNEVNEMRL